MLFTHVDSLKGNLVQWLSGLRSMFQLFRMIKGFPMDGCEMKEHKRSRTQAVNYNGKCFLEIIIFCLLKSCNRS